MDFLDFLNKLKKYAQSTSHIESVILVGSYARGTNREDSDLDLVIITAQKSALLAHQDFVREFGQVCKQQTEYYGACTSIRVWYEDGKEVEFGIVEPSWIDKPLDEGTYKVLSEGYKVIVDKTKYFANLKI